MVEAVRELLQQNQGLRPGDKVVAGTVIADGPATPTYQPSNPS